MWVKFPSVLPFFSLWPCEAYTDGDKNHYSINTNGQQSGDYLFNQIILVVECCVQRQSNIKTIRSQTVDSGNKFDTRFRFDEEN